MPRGRPSNGLSEVEVKVRAPAILKAAAAHAAAEEGCDVAEWWRRAARVRLGWHEVVPEVTPTEAPKRRRAR